MDGLRSIPAEQFARRLRVASEASEHRFAFFVGAGCSKTSGIPAAGELVERHWLPRLRSLCEPECADDVATWARREFDAFDPSNPAGSYGSVMEQLFLHPGERQAEIEKLCEGRFPRFGYAALASLIAHKSSAFNVVLTTNFDDLIADALYLFTDSRPLVIQHASLSEYIRPTRTRPLLVKVHGDHQLAPLNTIEETKELEGEFNRAIQSLLHDRGLIFLGYGGNDQGIRRMLESLSQESLPYGVYWVSRREPHGELRNWLISRSAVWVEYPDFDQFMLLLQGTFNLRRPDERRFEKVFQLYAEDYERLRSTIQALSDSAPSAPALKEAIRRTDASFSGEWGAILQAGRLQANFQDEAEQIYLRGIEDFPRSTRLLDSYADFLADRRGDPDRAEEYYRRAVDADPADAVALVSYALFLADRRGDPDRAGEYFRRAVDADPADAYALHSYGSFLADRSGDPDRAEEYFRRAVDADPADALALGSYAGFLADRRGDLDRAEEHYRRAVDADPSNALALRRYALFLADRRGDPDRAEEYFRRGVDANPALALALVSYADFLADRRGDPDRAEEYYRRAVDANPADAVALVSYAGFLAGRRGDPDRAEEFFRRAVDANPTDSFALRIYGSFLAEDRGDSDRAGEFFRRAVDANPADALALTRYAAFLANNLLDFERAEQLFHRGIEMLRASKNLSDLASALNDLGLLQYDSGDFAASLNTFKDAVDVYVNCNDQFGTAMASSNIGLTAHALGDDEMAGKQYRKALAIFRDVESVRGVVWSLQGIAAVAWEQGRHSVASRIGGAAEAIGATIESQPNAQVARSTNILVPIKCALENLNLAEAWASGRELSQADAVAEALSE